MDMDVNGCERGSELRMHVETSESDPNMHENNACENRTFNDPGQKQIEDVWRERFRVDHYPCKMESTLRP